MHAYLDIIKKSIRGGLDLQCDALEWNAESCMQVLRSGKVSSSTMTLLNQQRLDQLQLAIETVVAEQIHGDVLEAGCWKGGAGLLMQACLKHSKQHDVFAPRKVYLADLFADTARHYPVKTLCALQPFLKLMAAFHRVYPRSFKQWFVNKINITFPQDTYSDATLEHYFKVMAAGSWLMPYRLQPLLVQGGLAEVQAAFAKYDLLDDSVCFLPGWFADTLPVAAAEIASLALLRADGDFFASTKCILDNLYSKLSPGAFCIIDDYGAFPECRRAVDEFRQAHAITAPLHWIDAEAVYWRHAAS